MAPALVKTSESGQITIFWQEPQGEDTDQEGAEQEESNGEAVEDDDADSETAEEETGGDHQPGGQLKRKNFFF